MDIVEKLEKELRSLNDRPISFAPVIYIDENCRIRQFRVIYKDFEFHLEEMNSHTVPVIVFKEEKGRLVGISSGKMGEYGGPHVQV